MWGQTSRSVHPTGLEARRYGDVMPSKRPAPAPAAGGVAAVGVGGVGPQCRHLDLPGSLRPEHGDHAEGSPQAAHHLDGKLPRLLGLESGLDMWGGQLTAGEKFR